MIEGNLNISGKELTELPDLSKVVVRGNFSCSNNELTSLKGCPHIVGGDFICSDNQLTFGNYSFTYGTPGVSSGTVRNALADYFEDPGMAKQTVSNIKFENGSSTSNLNILWGGQSNTDGFNGTCVYNGAGTYTFTKQ